MIVNIAGTDYTVTITAIAFRGTTAQRVTVADADGVTWSERLVTQQYMQTIGVDALAEMDAQDAHYVKTNPPDQTQTEQ